MKTLVLLAASIVCCSMWSIADDVDRDTVAKKFGYRDWADFLKPVSMSWDWDKVDASKFSASEIAFVLKWTREAHIPLSGEQQLTSTWFVLLLKFKEPEAIKFVDREFSRGWYWAADAEEAVIATGELSLIPLAAKYLWVQEPSEPMPPMDEELYFGPPSEYAARAIICLLAASYQSPEALKKAARDKRVLYNNLPLLRRWWAANEDRLQKGDFDQLSKPVDYLKRQHRTP